MNELVLLAGSAPDALSPVLERGLSVIRLFQSIGHAAGTAVFPPLLFLVNVLSLAGEAGAYALILAVLFWCIDERRGFAAGLALFVSNGINMSLKNAFRVPRPFVADPSVKLADASGFSTPSAHAQNSAAFWPLLLAGAGTVLPGRRRAGRAALAILLPVLIGLSRIYLGVHYPTDVFFGWALGFAVSALALVALPALGRLFERAKDRFPSLGETFDSGTESGVHARRMCGIAGAAVLGFALNAASGGDPSMGGLVFGFGAGYAVLANRSPAAPRFSARGGTLVQKAGRLALGLGGLLFVLGALGQILPGAESVNGQLYGFARFAFAGFWTTCLAPLLFIRLKLA